MSLVGQKRASENINLTQNRFIRFNCLQDRSGNFFDGFAGSDNPWNGFFLHH